MIGSMPIESIDEAARELLALGADIEVVRPLALRRLVRDSARRVADMYSD
jgi:predicted DNA-binding transcriptional regulator YafY